MNESIKKYIIDVESRGKGLCKSCMKEISKGLIYCRNCQRIEWNEIQKYKNKSPRK